VLHNGTPITGSTWLRGGDVLDLGGGAPEAAGRGRAPRARVRSRAPSAMPRHRPVAGAVATAGGPAAGEDERIEPVSFRRPAAATAAPRAGCRGAGSRSPRVSRCSRRSRRSCSRRCRCRSRSPRTGARRVRGQLGRPALRQQPPAPARRLHAGRGARGLRDVAGARRDRRGARPAPELRARALPAASRWCWRCRAR